MSIDDNPSQNPYVGPRTFTYEDRQRFFGRESEAEALLARVISQRLLLFYAQSGAGKSSLINTRLVPKLREAGFAVLPVGRVGGDLPEDIDAVGNVYLFNLLLQLDSSGTDPGRFAHLNLTQFLAGLVSDDGLTWSFDPQAAAAGQASAEALEPTEAGTEVPTSQEDEEGGGYESLPYVLIIDQFEEVITNHPNRWQERADFFQQLNQAMRDDPNLWVVLTLREDYVAALEPYARYMDDRLSARFYMQRMGVEAALEAVKDPAEQAGRPFAEGVAERLVDNLRQIRVHGQQEANQIGQYVEPVQLQVVCYQLWENLAKDTGRVSADDSVTGYITQQDLRDAGDVDTALAAFYEAAIGHVLNAPDIGLSERQLRNWFDAELITEAGTRGTVYRGESETAGMPNRVVDLLQGQFLLRRELRAGGAWIELVHDRFVEPIQRTNTQWRASYNNPLTSAHQRWSDAGQSDDRLLSGYSLQEAQLFVEQNPGDVSDAEQVFLQRSRAHEVRQQEQRRRRTQIIALGVIVVLVALTSLSVVLMFQARSEKAAAADEAENARAAEIAAADEAKRAGEAEAAADAEADKARAAEAVADAEADKARAAEAVADAEAERAVAAEAVADAEADKARAAEVEADEEARIARLEARDASAVEKGAKLQAETAKLNLADAREDLRQIKTELNQSVTLANDEFPGTRITNLEFPEQIPDTFGAGLDDGEQHPCGNIGSTVWYHFTPQEDMELVAITTGSDYDTVLAVYMGKASTSGDIRPNGDLIGLDFVECNDDFGDQTSRLQIQAKLGETYYFQVGGYARQTGSLDFHLKKFGPFFNAEFPGTQIMTLKYEDSIPDVFGAGLEFGEPRHCGDIGSTVWYHFTPQQDMEFVADTIGSQFDTVLAVYKEKAPTSGAVRPSSDFEGLELVICNDDLGKVSDQDIQRPEQLRFLENSKSRITITAQAGENYYIQVGAFDERRTGSLAFNLWELELLSNAEFPGSQIATLSFEERIADTGETRLDVQLLRECGDIEIGSTVWYHFTPRQDIDLVADTSGSDFDTVLAVYRGPGDVRELEIVDCSDLFGKSGQARVLIRAKAGETYYFQVGGFGGQTGSLVFNLRELELLSNAEFPGTRITTLGFEERIPDTSNTTTDDQSLRECGIAIGSTVWYHFTPEQDIYLVADTFGSDFDTVLAVYKARGVLDELEFVACNDDSGGSSQSRLSIRAKAGETYYFQVGGFGGQTGSLVFNLRELELLSNAEFPGAEITTLAFQERITDTSNTTVDVQSLPECGDISIGSTVWYHFAPEQDIDLVADTFGSDFDTVLAIYQRPADTDGLELVGCNDESSQSSQSRVTIRAKSGETYYLQVGGFGGQTGSLVFNLRELELLPNAEFPGTQVTTLGFEDRISDTSNTALDVRLLRECGEVEIGSTVWYRFTPRQDIDLVADTFGSDFDTVLAVYQGPEDLNELEFVGCNDESGGSSQSRVTIRAKSGETYYFQVGGFVGQTGSLVFNLRELELLSNAEFPGIKITTLEFQERISDTSKTTGDLQLLRECGDIEIGSTVWYHFTPEQDIDLVADTFGSDFDTVLAVYKGPEDLTVLAVYQGPEDPTVLEFVDCNDDSGQSNESRVAIHALSGVTYYFQVGGFAGQTGPLVFNLR